MSLKSYKEQEIVYDLYDIKFNPCLTTKKCRPGLVIFKKPNG